MLLTSAEMKKLLKVSDCELMHQRERGDLVFEKRGNAFFYHIPPQSSLLNYPLGKQLLDWYRDKHKINIDNTPASTETTRLLEKLVTDILIPIERVFGAVTVTYGFTSVELKKYIQKSSPAGTAPIIDQHASCELNQQGKLICERGGASCDFTVRNRLVSEVTRFIVKNLNFDRVYYYGEHRPLHVSVSDYPVKHLQVMQESRKGRRYPGKKGFGNDAITLSMEL